MLPREIECFLCWLEIRAAAGGRERLTPSGLRIDAGHSALLRRLLDGKEPLVHPPPKAHGYPWYELVEEGRGEPLEAFKRPGSDDQIVINQHPWTLVRELGPDDWEVRYRDDGDLWRCHCTDPGDGKPLSKKWVLERVA